jgi:hypothetical protein
MTRGQYDGRVVLHLVGDVQRFGLISAARIVDRYIGVIDRAMDGDGLLAPVTPDARDLHVFAEGAGLMAQAYLAFSEATATLLDNRGREYGGRQGIERLVLPRSRPGSPSEAVLWMHNPTSTPTALRLHVTSLEASTGATIPAGLISLVVPGPDTVEAGTSRDVQVRVDVPAHQAAGSYHGLVLSSEPRCEPLAIQLDVVDPREDRH